MRGIPSTLQREHINKNKAETTKRKERKKENARKDSINMIYSLGRMQRRVGNPTYVCQCVWAILSPEYGSPGYSYLSFLWSAEQGEYLFPCPRSRLIIWSREAGSAVPSRVSPLTLHTLLIINIIG